MTSVYIGSYGGRVALARQDPGTGALEPTGVAAETPAPSFLAWHPDGRHLYAVNEAKDGTVTALEADSLRVINTQPTGGAEPCHLVVHPAGRHLLTANYGSGSVSVHLLRSDGSIGPRTDLVQHQGRGPHDDRQEGPHAHHVRVTPDGAHVLAVDLGLDSIFTYRLDLDTGRLALETTTRTAPGAGPRHLVFGADGTIHVACELNSTVTSLRHNGSSVTPSTVDPGPQDNFPSEIAISADGRYVYVANRGKDVVTVFNTSAMKPLVDVPTGGTWPRHVAIAGRYLYVANQQSDQVVCFLLDQDTGMPERTGDAFDIPHPACVLIPQ